MMMMMMEEFLEDENLSDSLKIDWLTDCLIDFWWTWLSDVAGFWGSADVQKRWNITSCDGEDCESRGL